MSETDDRMERAERIRQMRESREPGEDSETGDGGESSDAGEADVGTVDGDDPGDERPDVGSSADGPDHDQSPGTQQVENQSSGNRPSGNRSGENRSGTSDSTPSAATASAATSNRSPDADASDASTTDERTGGTTTDDGTASRQQEAETSAGAAVSEASPSGGVAPLGGSSGFSLPGQAEMDAAASSASDPDADEGTTGAARARDSATATATEPSVRVLEFTVGEQIYCIDIESVEEIVKRETVTRVPNTEAYVEGVVDLRGQITTILDTRRLLDVEEAGPENLLVIFAPDGFEEHGTVGWVVDEVRQVVPVTDSQVRSAPSQEEHVRGIVDREDEDALVVWIRPGDAMARAVTVDGGD